MKFSSDCNEFRRWHEAGKGQVPPADVQIVTSDGHRIAAHSNVLASASPVLENMVYGPRRVRDSERTIQILGVPSEVVFAFLQFIYSCRSSASSSAEAMEAIGRHGVQLLVLAHKFRIGWIKTACEAEMGRRLTADSAVDVLQIAKLCAASRLRQACLSFIYREFASVQNSDGWRFAQRNDPRLELEILRFLQDTDQRRKRWRRQKGDQEMYVQLSEAMECLEHICTEGCTNVGPRDGAAAASRKGPCARFDSCEGLQMLIRHFAVCGNKKACIHCKRMWRLFRLHSSLCGDRSGSCRVPLCKEFRLRVERKEKGDDATWRLLVKKVGVARVMSSLAKRKRPEEGTQSRARSQRRMR